MKRNVFSHPSLLFALLVLAFGVLALGVLTGCTQATGTPSDTLPASSATEPDKTDTPTEPTTEPDTTPGTAPETVPETESETETEEVTTAEPEDLSLPENALAVFYADALSEGRRPVNGVKQVNNLTRTLNEEAPDKTDHYCSLLASGKDPYIYLCFDSMTPAGRYMQIKYRTTSAHNGQLYLGTTRVSDAGMQPLTYTSDGMWHLLTVDLYDNLCYSGSVFSYLRLDPLDGGDEVKDETVDVAWIAILPDDGAAFEPTLDLPELPPDTPDLSAYETLSEGVYIRTSGAISEDMGTYTFRAGLTFDVYYRAAFNRFTVRYDSTAPIRGEITYLLPDGNGQYTPYTETFFLEAGSDMTFSSLIDGYFASQYAVGISKIVLSACRDEEASFTLYGIDTNVARAYASGTYFIENERYRVGVLLAWGGGISYIEDKQDNDDTLTNLINNHDTGRLIQQSYYGIPCAEYSPASYNGTPWNYNPVQGGDQYGNASKIVDFTVSADGRSVYVKARPMDWAQKNMPCPAYMENTYTLEGDAILVDNRFMDFFGQVGPKRHQELPAFYTISYLCDFRYYNGSAPWTNDEYITLTDLPFWGGNGDAYHKIQSGNTETWAAWTSPTGYGIGLYVPGAKIMLAGRHNYTGSKSGSNDGTNYVAPLRSMKLVSYEVFAYSYVISAGTVDEMRQVFAKQAGVE